jgi:protein-S-isoprenylcysteine O-methyltransferase Ste14
MITEKELKIRHFYYLSNIVLIWLAVFFYKTNGYYAGFLSEETQLALFLLASAYSIFGFFIYIINPDPVSETKGAFLLRALYTLSKEAWQNTTNFSGGSRIQLPKISKEEKTAFLFTLVEFIFLPMMLNFFFMSYSAVENYFLQWQKNSYSLTIEAFIILLYPLLLSLLGTIHYLVYSFGYATESPWLGNRIKSVDSTFLGWAVTLVCYPPLILFAAKIIYDYRDLEGFHLESVWFTAIGMFAILLLTGIYVWATIALGAKSSNLTNRGIVNRGPYAIVRHPAYTSKLLAWWISIIPLLSLVDVTRSFVVIACTAIWTYVHYLRAITEENHLIRDPDYVKYCKKVKYRFIPYVY